MEKTCANYEEYVIDRAKDKLKSRKELIEEKAKLRQEFQAKMQAEAALRFQQLKEQMLEERKLINQRKNKEFDFLKAQMESDLKRREDEKLLQKQEDKEYMSKLMNNEFEINPSKKELVKQIK